MTNEEVAIMLEGHDHEIKSLKHRMDDAEETSKALNSMATSMALIAQKQDSMSQTVDVIGKKVDTLEQVPAKRWEGLVEKLLYVLAGAFILWLFSGAPVV